MARRRYGPNHLIRIKKRIANTSDFETLYEFYARRRDTTASRKDSEGVDIYQMFTDYVIPPEIVTKLPQGFESLQDEEAFGQQTFGTMPFGGRGRVSPDRFETRGGHVEPYYFIEDVQRKTTVAIVGILEYAQGCRMLRTIKIT